jgi:hypothetical protein
MGTFTVSWQTGKDLDVADTRRASPEVSSANHQSVPVAHRLALRRSLRAFETHPAMPAAWPPLPGLSPFARKR